MRLYRHGFHSSVNPRRSSIIPLRRTFLEDSDRVVQHRELAAVTLGGEGTFIESWPRGPFRIHGLFPQKEFQSMDEFNPYWLSRIPLNVDEVPDIDYTTLLSNEQILLTRRLMSKYPHKGWSYSHYS